MATDICAPRLVRPEQRSFTRALLLTLPILCAVKGAGPQWVQFPPGNWIAPPGSNRSSRGGNESAGAFGVEGREGDLAIMQAVMDVNAEQAPKQGMQEPTRR
jgi:hypothetical protein